MTRCRTRLPQVAILALVAVLTGCSDGATRIAYQLESEAAAFRDAAAATTRVVRHLPKRMPEGCSAAYTIQFSANSSLLIWCKTAVGGRVTASHTTTYHLRFVKVPQTLIVDKPAGEPTFIELTKQDGEIVVTGLR